MKPRACFVAMPFRPELDYFYLYLRRYLYDNYSLDVERGDHRVAVGPLLSLAFASWSGVVYHPTAPTRALAETELVACELSVQAAWSYCNFIRSEVERGKDPLVPVEYGWRFVRGLRSRLTAERPQETSQHRSTREAIIETSGLARHLADAVETLREADGGHP